MKVGAVFLMLWAAPCLAGPIAEGDLSDLPPADVVILGEIHDNPVHHANQAQAVAAIAPRAVVFEMLTPAQVAAMPADRSDAAALAAAFGWANSGWPDFAMYFPIFAAAPTARIYGGDLPRDLVRQAVKTGAAGAFGAGAARYGLDTALPPADQTLREADQRDAHCGALPEALLAGMVQAQRLRDAALARAVVQAMDDTGGPVVVITGSGHARRDTGVPAVLALAAPDVSVLTVGQVEADPGPDAPYDLWIVTPPTPRDDPCAPLTGN